MFCDISSMNMNRQQLHTNKIFTYKYWIFIPKFYLKQEKKFNKDPPRKCFGLQAKEVGPFESTW
jgi:hypothetical protein